MSIPTYTEVTLLLKTESDRGAILIVAAQIEEALGALLQGICISEATAGSLLKHGQPAGTFEFRVLLCHALGLIHEQEVHALRLIQKIRNKAAHFDRSGRGFNVLFDSSPTVDQVIQLAIILGFDKPQNELAAIRDSFITSAQHLVTVLTVRRFATKPVTSIKSIEELAAEYMEIISTQSSPPPQGDMSTPPLQRNDLWYWQHGAIY